MLLVAANTQMSFAYNLIFYTFSREREYIRCVSLWLLQSFHLGAAGAKHYSHTKTDGTCTRMHCVFRAFEMNLALDAIIQMTACF